MEKLNCWCYLPLDKEMEMQGAWTQGCLLEDKALFVLFDYSSYFTVENEG